MHGRYLIRARTKYKQIQISAETKVGFCESSKCSKIKKVFEDAYKSQLSIIILDDIERYLELLVKWDSWIQLVIGTTSEVGFLDSLGICDAFSVPTFRTADAKRSRGFTRHDTGVHDRPERLEVQVEVTLPDENGRLQIHTNMMKENSFLAPDVNFQVLAARTKNYSRVELEGVVKSAVSFSLNRQLSLADLTKTVDEESIKVTMDDFLHALHEIVPAFGASTDNLERCRLDSTVDCGERHKHIYQRVMLLVEQVKVISKGSSLLVTCLLEGPSGSGKTAMAATVGLDSDFAYVKIISAETMIGLSESSKCSKLVKVFEDAHKSQLSIIILDDIERLLEYVAIGPRFSNLISRTLMVLLKRLPPKGKNMLVIGTTSAVEFLDSLGICDAFSVTYPVPTLRTADAKKVLEHLNVFSEDDIDAAAEALNDMPIKKIYMLKWLHKESKVELQKRFTSANRRSASLISLIVSLTSCGDQFYTYLPKTIS